MTSRDRVLIAMNRGRPDRVPLWYGADEAVTQGLISRFGLSSEEELLQSLHIDFRRVFEKYVGPPLEIFPDGTRNTIWGVKRGGSYYGQPLSHPLAHLEDARQLEEHPWPKQEWFDFSGVREQCRSWKDYAVIGGAWSPFFTDATELVGMEKFMTDIALRPQLIHGLLDKVLDFYVQLSRRFFAAAGGGIDIFFFGDDYGTQKSLFVSPKMWREFFKPRAKRLVDLGHSHGAKAMLHSCGAVSEIIPDLIEIGLDAINPVQTRAAGMQPERLKKLFGGKICFHGGIDEQVVLAFGTPDEVRKEVRRVIDILGREGGYCLAASHDYLIPEIPLENIVAMYEEACRYGRY